MKTHEYHRNSFFLILTVSGLPIQEVPTSMCRAWNSQIWKSGTEGLIGYLFSYNNFFINSRSSHSVLLWMLRTPQPRGYVQLPVIGSASRLAEFSGRTVRQYCNGPNINRYRENLHQSPDGPFLHYHYRKRLTIGCFWVCPFRNEHTLIGQGCNTEQRSKQNFFR